MGIVYLDFKLVYVKTLVRYLMLLDKEKNGTN